MDSKTTDSVKACLNELRATALKAFKMQVMKIYSSEHPLDPITETMVSGAVRDAERNVRQLLGEAVSRVSVVSKAHRAFALIDDAMADHLLDLQDVIEQGRGIRLYPTVRRVVDEKFRTVREEVIRKLENHRPVFSGSKGKSGRDPEWDWEAAKAYVKTKFPDGFPDDRRINGKIVKIMADYFDSNSKDAEDVPQRTQLYENASKLINELR